MSKHHSLITQLFLIFILYQLSSCDDSPCIYKESRNQKENNKTDASFLANLNSEDSKKQKCFSLSNSDVFTNLCCYNKNTKLCAVESTSDTNIECPHESEIINNCGMASFYQPVTQERCTEISLVDGFCCFIKTKNHGTGCVKKKEIDKDDKNAITDDIKNYLKGLSNPIDPDDIDSMKCKGSFFDNYFYAILFLISIINVLI